MNNTGKIIKSSEGLYVEVLGDEHLIKLNAADTNGIISIIEQTYKPNTGSSSHLHEKDSHIFLVLEGTFSINIGDKDDEISKGDIAYIPFGTFHSFKVISSTIGKALVFTFPAGLENIFIELSEIDLLEEDFNFDTLLKKYGIKLKNKASREQSIKRQ